MSAIARDSEREPRASQSAPWELFRRTVAIRTYRASDAAAVCAWVNEASELPLISGETGAVLTPQILEKWAAQALRTFVFELRGEAIAFATASIAEARLPQDSIEICHLVVAPRLRRRYHGSFFCRWISQLLLEGDAYHSVVGRVVRTNIPGLALMNYLRWEEILEDQGWAEAAGCRWFTTGGPRGSK